MGPFEIMLTAFLWGLAAIWFAWLTRHQALAVFRHLLAEHEIEGGPEAIPYLGISPNASLLCDEVNSLGFRPLGVYRWTIPPLQGQDICFMAPSLDCFAAVFRLRKRASVVTFLTIFNSGAIVRTQNFCGLEANLPNLRSGPPVSASRRSSSHTVDGIFAKWVALVPHMVVHWLAIAGGGIVAAYEFDRNFKVFVILAALVLYGLVYLARKPKEQAEKSTNTNEQHWPVAVVLAEHRRRIAEFVASGHAPLAHQTMEQFCELERSLEEMPTVRRLLLFTNYFLLGMTILAFVAVPCVVSLNGITHPAILAIVALTECLLMTTYSAWLRGRSSGAQTDYV